LLFFGYLVKSRKIATEGHQTGAIFSLFFPPQSAVFCVIQLLVEIFLQSADFYDVRTRPIFSAIKLILAMRSHYPWIITRKYDEIGQHWAIFLGKVPQRGLDEMWQRSTILW